VREREATREALEALRRDFRDSFGRDPGPDDPVFFDPSAEEPQSVDEYGVAMFTQMSEMAMRRAGIDPSMVYAWHKTGLIVTERNQHLLSADDWEDWIEAIFEYEGCFILASWISRVSYSMMWQTLAFSQSRGESRRALRASRSRSARTRSRAAIWADTSRARRSINPATWVHGTLPRSRKSRTPRISPSDSPIAWAERTNSRRVAADAS
jgi:hypothetical protein